MSDLCPLCNRDELTAEEQIEHTAQLIEDYAILYAMCNGNPNDQAGKRKYMERGGRIHLTTEEARGGVDE